MMSEAQKTHEHNEQECISRREYLISLKKWSKIAIGAAVLGASVLGTSKDAKAAGWVNRRGGGGVGWGNGGGGAWGNGSTGGWRNGGATWVNRRGGGGWVNR